MAGEQLADLDAGDAGLVEPVKLGGELADGTESRQAGDAQQERLQRGDVQCSQWPTGVARAECLGRAVAPAGGAEQQQRCRATLVALPPRPAEGSLVVDAGLRHLDPCDDHDAVQTAHR